MYSVGCLVGISTSCCVLNDKGSSMLDVEPWHRSRSWSLGTQASGDIRWMLPLLSVRRTITFSAVEH